MVAKIDQEVEIKNPHSVFFHKKGTLISVGIDPVPEKLSRADKQTRAFVVRFSNGQEFGFSYRELQFIKASKNN